MEFILFLLATVLYLCSTAIVNGVSRTMHTRIKVPRIKIALPDEVPSSFAQSTGKYAQHCLPCGFVLSHYEEHEALEVSIRRRRLVAVYFHSDEKSYAELKTPSNPSDEKPIVITFGTIFAHKKILTVDITEGMLLSSETENLSIFRSDHQGVESQWQQHLQHMRAFEASCEGAPHRIRLNLCDYSRRTQREAQQYIDDTYSCGLLTQKADGFQITAAAIKKIVVGGKQDPVDIGEVVDKAIPQNLLSNDELTQFELQVYSERRQFEKNTNISFEFKLSAFVLSGLACGAFMGYVFSWDMLIYLMPVLLLHELGHLLAMLALGYERKFMLFMPLGALVTGEKDDAATWQQMVVYLAGPIPGILLGLGLLLILPAINESMQSFITILLLINCLNLIPVKPLDGGQLVSLLISNRYPVIQFVLHLVSFLIALCVGLLIDSAGLMIVAVWLGLGIKSAYDQIRLFRCANSVMQSGANNKQLVESLFALMRGMKGDFNARYDQIRGVVTNMSHRTSSPAMTCTFMCLYVAALIGPPVIVFSNFHNSIDKLVSANNQGSYDEHEDYQQYLDEQLADATTGEQRVDLLIDAAYRSQYESEYDEAWKHLSDAWDLSESDELLSDYRSGIHSMMYRQKVETGNHEEAGRLLQEIELLSANDEAYGFELIDIYRTMYVDNDLPSEERIAWSIRALEKAKMLDDFDVQISSTIDLATVYFFNDKKQRAYELLTKLSLETVNDQANQHYVVGRLSEQYTMDGELETAIGLIQGLSTVADDDEYYLLHQSEKLGWLSALNDDVYHATHYFNIVSDTRIKIRNSYQEDIGFVTKVVLSAISDSSDWSPENEVPRLVLAYLEKNPDKARSILNDMNRQWSELYEYDDTWGTLKEYFARGGYSQEHVGSLHSRKANLIRKAIEFAESV